MKRFLAHFQPQAWISNYAEDVDDEGDDVWDCTAAIGPYLDDNDEPRYPFRRGTSGDWVDNDDVLKDDPNAPEWVRTWDGPFCITVSGRDR